jgi:hypothetical protein
MEQSLDFARSLYQQKRLVPFIGAGMSYPFKIPTWGEMILQLSAEFVPDSLQAAIKHEIERRKDYWAAVEGLLKYSERSEFEIQQAIVSLIQKRQLPKEAVVDHNYLDIGSMDFRIYLTTNYDYLIHDHVEGNCHHPLMLSQCNVSTQEMILDPKKRIFHLHGQLSDTGSIVISRNKYDELYNLERYKQLFAHFCSSYTFLFIGFSFEDHYISDLIKKYKDYFNTKHFIILDRPHPSLVEMLKKEYLLEVIPYDSTIDGHTQGIRTILQQLQMESQVMINQEQIDDFLLPPVVQKGQLQQLEGHLFAKKLKIENIDPAILEMSKEFYYYADAYIRKMRKKRMPENLIQTILTLCFMKYKILKHEFHVHKDSQRLVNDVHAALENIDYGRAKQYLDNASPYDFEKKGFAHILADDEQKDLWWGNKRFTGDEADGAVNDQTS